MLHLKSLLPISTCALLIVATCGCGSAAKPTTSLVKGKVTYKGEAIADAKVQLQSPENGAAAVAKSDATGAYKIESPLPLGKYNVTVEPWNDPVSAPPPSGYKPKDNPKILKKYRSAATSGLTLQAKAGSNDLDIPMVD